MFSLKKGMLQMIQNIQKLTKYGIRENVMLKHLQIFNDHDM